MTAALIWLAASLCLALIFGAWLTNNDRTRW
jgi:hypothetical protein